MKPVSIYTTVTCGYCKMAKEFFQKNNVEFQEFDVGKDLERRKEMIEKSGQMGVPVIMVGEDMIIGFNKPKLEQLLNITQVA
ncbi:MAG: NrdH-redoxin [Candidatus Lloydbacteria bacterium RIFCSPHIGHO2_02_FULL_50_13]|uniref:NrdH-redoxin n=1 Tax=Candidatus Lloydbacteria bacterium RIFCSPHIGHO2_02_FULL_50_13 TaxID=1798661 RepID=A0A1G2DA66_9BACT|nr:MAG: NrdH-redoxin [Candidatus Lloydbacteria bacterium RIFCSPHIGHO2_02_FULL_50_13]